MSCRSPRALPNVRMHNLVDHPPAPTVEVHGLALVGSPNLLVPVCAGQLLKVAEQQTCDATASAVWSHDHAEQPGRAVVALLDVERS